ncbi:MAG: O-antigen ligase family protein [Lentisphaeria bacterium]|nr:O-antigen ligase family protein [Lentisphaeria bacterium]
MSGIKKFIEKLDMVPEGKELSLRQKITLVLWGLTVFFLPYLYVPYFIFQKLSLYPLVLIAIINIDKWWKLCWNNKFLRYTAFGIAAFIIWQIISLPFNLGLSNINFADHIKPSINEAITLVAWYIFLAAAFMFPKEKIEKTFYWCITTVFICCCAYSVIEILHFAKVQWATDFLGKSIHYLIKGVGEYFNWHPPVFWDSPRLRSVFSEPSNFAVLSTFTLLYYGCYFWLSTGWKKMSGNILLMILSFLALCGTQSASGTLALSTATLFFVILFAVFFRKFNKLKKIKGIVFSFLLIVFTFIIALNQRGGISDWKLLFDKATDGVQKQVVSEKKQVVPEKKQIVSGKKQIKFSSSSNTRLIHLKAEIKLIARKPVCGYGEYGNVMRQSLWESPEKTREVLLWCKNEDFSPPTLNKYTGIIVKYGIVGLLFFFAIFFPAIILLYQAVNSISPEKWIYPLILCIAIATILATCPINVLFYSILLTLPLRLYSIDDSAERKNQ